VAEIKADIKEFGKRVGKLETRIEVVENRVNRSTALQAVLSAALASIAGWLGMRN